MTTRCTNSRKQAKRLKAALHHSGFERPDPPGVESDGPGLATTREGPWIMTKVIVFRGRDARVGCPKNEIGHPKNDRLHSGQDRLRARRQHKNTNPSSYPEHDGHSGSRSPHAVAAGIFSVSEK